MKRCIEAARPAASGQRQGAVAMVTDIDTAALIDKLQAFALSDAPGTMSKAEVDAAIALLDRALPDLHYFQPRAAGGQPILVRLANTASADNCPITKRVTK